MKEKIEMRIRQIDWKVEFVELQIAEYKQKMETALESRDLEIAEFMPGYATKYAELYKERKTLLEERDTLTMILEED